MVNYTATIKLFLPFGDPKKVRTAEISNWSGKAIAAPRSDLEHFLSRDELSKPGVYFLLGTDPEDGRALAYIGEAESVSDRIKQHRAKDYWNSAIAFVSKDENLTKGHIRYLEGRLIEMATEIGRCKIANSQCSGARLPESDQHDMEVYLDRIGQLLPVLGSDILTPIAAAKKEAESQPLFFCAMKGAVAKGERAPNGFVVYAGSSAVLEDRASAKKQGPWIIALRKKLRDEGALAENSGLLLFTRNVEFSSPSAAAAVIHGGNAAGPLAWRDKNGKTLKEIEEFV
jgi:hypothetical protein